MVIDLMAIEDMIGKIGICYICGKAKRIAIQHSNQITEYSEGPLRMICDECAGFNDQLFNYHVKKSDLSEIHIFSSFI